MWQLVVAAAVAGSGLYAKHFLKNVDQATKSVHEEETVSVDPEISETCDDPKSSGKQNLAVNDEKGIFRFSSGSRLGLLKKVGLWRNVKSVNKRRIKGEKIDKKYNTYDVEEERNKRKKISVHLKRRRTNKNALRKCGSFSSDGYSSFEWGIGLGIMYMISAGKTEINKMNETIEETAKVVSKLDSVLSKRKQSRCQKVNDGSRKVIEDKNKQPPELYVSTNGACPDDTKVLGHSSIDGESDSSTVTEEPDFSQLEAELDANC